MSCHAQLGPLDPVTKDYMWLVVSTPHLTKVRVLVRHVEVRERERERERTGVWGAKRSNHPLDDVPHPHHDTTGMKSGFCALLRYNRILRK